MPRESIIVSKILRYLNSIDNCVAEKLQGTVASSGKADISGCYKGCAFRIEVKTPDHGNKPSKKQEVNLKRWRAAGAYCCIAYSLDDAVSLIEKINTALTER